MKDLKYIKEGWKTQTINGVQWGVQGETPNYTYFTQQQRAQDYYNHQWYDNLAKRSDVVGWSAAQYKEWEDMHDPNTVMWYDTAGCMDTMRIYKSFKSMQFSPS